MSIALSYSRLSTYEQCPRKFKLQFLDKAFPDDSMNPHFIYGQEVHKQLENYVVWRLTSRGDKPKVTEPAAHVIPMVDKIINSHDECYPELKMAINDKLQPCGWFDKDVMYRAVIDFIAINGKEAVVIDYKTGKVREYSGWGGQLHLTAWIVSLKYPHLERITTAYLFADHKHTMSLKFTEEDMPKIREHFQAQHELVNQDTEFGPKKNRYCYFCPATNLQCEYK